ncbi:MAG: prepilin-type N-terminal cleavage/methylation domain-containing protein [Desulfobulbaceae bacterium]|nr:prepilin-type N-terminal cleavage/methylation domain-containing protein [Desulfobulbaceae bacterium]
MATKPVKKRYSFDTESSQSGFTLFEVLIAVLLLAMISSMIYSILNVSIKFAEKGEKKILLMEREQGLLGLLQRQIKSAWYDDKSKQVLINADEERLNVVTRAPLLNPQVGTVLALYRYDPGSATLYYTEKRDFYNIEYADDYAPDYEDMMVLMDNCPPLTFSYPEESSDVTVEYDGSEYEFWPWCQVSSRENDQIR